MASSEASYISDPDVIPDTHFNEESHDEIHEVSDDSGQSETGSTASSGHVEPWFAPSDTSPLPGNATMSTTAGSMNQPLCISINQEVRTSGLPTAPVQPDNDAKSVSYNRIKQFALENSVISRNDHAVYAVRVLSQSSSFDS